MMIFRKTNRYHRVLCNYLEFPIEVGVGIGVVIEFLDTATPSKKNLKTDYIEKLFLKKNNNYK